MRFGGKAARVAAAAGVLAAGGVVAADEAVPTRTSVEATVELDEVQIIGKRLDEMRQDIVKAEDKFWARFNELNKDDDYDVHCSMDAPTGTRFKYRNCRPVFFSKAQEAEARYFLTGDWAPPADLVALERGPIYEAKALAVINAHPELRKLIRERDELEKKYSETRKKRFKGRWILFE